MKCSFTCTLIREKVSENFISVRDGPKKLQKHGRDKRMQKDYLTFCKKMQKQGRDERTQGDYMTSAKKYRNKAVMKEHRKNTQHLQNTQQM